MLNLYSGNQYKKEQVSYPWHHLLPELPCSTPLKPSPNSSFEPPQNNEYQKERGGPNRNFDSETRGGYKPNGNGNHPNIAGNGTENGLNGHSNGNVRYYIKHERYRNNYINTHLNHF